MCLEAGRAPVQLLIEINSLMDVGYSSSETFGSIEDLTLPTWSSLEKNAARPVTNSDSCSCSRHSLSFPSRFSVSLRFSSHSLSPSRVLLSEFFYFSCKRVYCQHLGQTNSPKRQVYHVSFCFLILVSRYLGGLSPIIYLIRSNSLPNLLHRVHRVIYIVFPSCCCLGPCPKGRGCLRRTDGRTDTRWGVVYTFFLYLWSSSLLSTTK